MSDPKFKEGDVVSLRSGGPKMTVLDCDENLTTVVFYDPNSFSFYQNYKLPTSSLWNVTKGV